MSNGQWINNGQWVNNGQCVDNRVPPRAGSRLRRRGARAEGDVGAVGGRRPLAADAHVERRLVEERPRHRPELRGHRPRRGRRHGGDRHHPNQTQPTARRAVLTRPRAA